MPEVKELTEYQRAATVARYVQIRDVALERIDSSLVVPRREALKKSPWDLRFKKTVAHEFRAKANELIVRVNLDARVSASAAHDSLELLSFSCTYLLEYSFAAFGGPEGHERDAFLKAFAEVNGVYNAWPYFRELLQSTAARMGLPPVVVPVYRATGAPSERKVPENTAESTQRRRSKRAT